MPFISVVCSVREEVVLIRWWELNTTFPAAGELCILGEQPNPQDRRWGGGNETSAVKDLDHDRPRDPSGKSPAVNLQHI